MAATDFDYLDGKLEIFDRPATLRFGRPWDFVAALTRILKVRFPVGRNHKLTIVGTDTPSPDDTDKLWVKVDRERNPMGFYSFVKGQFRRYYSPAPGEIRWVWGDSNYPPDGWRVVDNDTAPQIPASVRNQLKVQYVPTPGDPLRYLYFAVWYAGY